MEALAQHAQLWSQGLSVCGSPRILHYQHTRTTGKGGYSLQANVSGVSRTRVASFPGIHHHLVVSPTYMAVPHSGKLSWERTFANWDFANCLLLVPPKDATHPNFEKETFVLATKLEK